MNTSKSAASKIPTPRDEMIGTVNAWGGEPVVVKAHAGRYDVRRVELVATAADGTRVALSFNGFAAASLSELLRDAVKASHAGGR